MRLYFALILLAACGDDAAHAKTDDPKSPVSASSSSSAGTPVPGGGTNACDPRTGTSAATTKLASPIVGRAADGTLFVIDGDVGEPNNRVFISHGNVLERHAFGSAGGALDGLAPSWQYFVDAGLPNALTLGYGGTAANESLGITGDGWNEQLTKLDSSALAGFVISDDAPSVLAFSATEADGNRLFIFTTARSGQTTAARVFYGPPSAIAERTFGAFAPPNDPGSSAPATSVTFDVNGTPMTLATVVTSRPSTATEPGLAFLCF